MPTPELRGQFGLVSPEHAGRMPPGWNRTAVGDYVVVSHPATRLTPVTSAGEPAGVLLGVPIDLDAARVIDELALPAARSGEALFQLGAEASERLSGRFAIILSSGRLCRIYMDAGGQFPVVFSPELDAAASSSTVLMDEQPSNDDLLRLLNFPLGGTAIPFGLTAFRGVSRLLPNHHLELPGCKVERHWPHSEIEPISDVASAVEEIASLIERQIEAAAGFAPLHVALTAGQDSRALVAAATRALGPEGFRCFVVDHQRLDTKGARWVTHQLGVPLDVQEPLDATPEQLDEWMRVVGHSVSGAVWRSAATALAEEPSRMIVSGIGGTVARSYWWREGDQPDTTIDVAGLLARMRLPAADPLAEAAAEWVADAPAVDSLALLDLLYIEQRVGAWGGPQTIRPTSRAFPPLSPYCQRRIVEIVLALPPVYRRQGRLQTDLCRLMRPELLEIPVNEWWGWEGLVRRGTRPLRRRLHLSRSA